MTTTTAAQSEAPVRDLAQLPKGHLHLHMEAAMRPDTLVSLSRKLGIEPPETAGFQGFSAFSTLYQGLLAALRYPGHLNILMDQIFEDQAADGVAYLELSVSPNRYVDEFGSVAGALEAFLHMAEESAERYGVAFGLMPTIDRTASFVEGMELAQASAALAGPGVTALGLAADERNHPGRDFADCFRVAKDAGLQVAPHAGELVGSESVREALEVLDADRILHGVRAVEDRGLVQELAERGVPLDVCPTSNILLDVVDDIAKHPIIELLDAGVQCSINADDPILFGPNILSEYELCRTRIGLTDEQLAACAASSISTTHAPESVKTESLRKIRDWLA